MFTLLLEVNIYITFRFISDMVVVIVSATIGGIIFACLGQPVCIATRYDSFGQRKYLHVVFHGDLSVKPVIYVG